MTTSLGAGGFIHSDCDWWPSVVGERPSVPIDVYAEVPEAQRAKTTAAMDRFLKAG